MASIELKIKAKHLAAESRIIKNEEQKFLRYSRKGKAKYLKNEVRRKTGLCPPKPGEDSSRWDAALRAEMDKLEASNATIAKHLY